MQNIGAGQGSAAHISKGNEALVKEEQHPQEQEEEAQAGKANANLCMHHHTQLLTNTRLISAHTSQTCCPARLR